MCVLVFGAMDGEQSRTGELGVWCGGGGEEVILCGVVGGGFIIKVTYEHRSEESEAKFRFCS